MSRNLVFLRNKKTWLALCVVTCLLLTQRVQNVHAQTAQASLTVTPATLQLAPTEQGNVLVVARLGDVTAQDLKLDYFAEPALAVDIAQPERAGAQRGDVAWRVNLTRAANGRANGKVFFVATFTTRNARNEPIPNVLTTTLDIQERAPASLETVLDAKLETALDNIQDQKTRTVFVILTNKSTIPVTVTKIIPSEIPHFHLTPQDVGSGIVLQPQETRPFTITVTALDQVEIGKQLLVVQTNATWEKDGQRVNGSSALRKEFQVGVFGEQEILTATAIPSFFLLPGFLFVITSLLLLKWSWKKEPIPLNLKEPQFWIFGITLSLLAVILYPFLTRIIFSLLYRREVEGRNLLQGYGFTDILYLWFGAVLLAIFLWAILSAFVLVTRWLKRFFQQRYARTHHASSSDKPVTLLNKLANNHLGFALEQVEFKRNGKSQIVFALPRALGAPDGKRWVVPAARVTIQGEGARERKQIFSAQLDKADDPRALENLLRTWGEKIAIVEWEPANADALVREPILVETTETQEIPNARQSFLALA